MIGQGEPNRSGEPTNDPQLDFCVGKDLLSCDAETEILFPLFRGEDALLTDSMAAVTLTIIVDGTIRELYFSLK